MCVGVRLAMVRSAAQMLAEINRHLPSDIVLHAMTPAVGGFDAKNQCSMRRYEYLLPAYAIMRPAGGGSPWQPGGGGGGGGEISHKGVEMPAALLAPQIQLLRGQLRRYEGTHSFHNFTPKLVRGRCPPLRRRLSVYP